MNLYQRASGAAVLRLPASKLATLLGGHEGVNGTLSLISSRGAVIASSAPALKTGMSVSVPEEMEAKSGVTMLETGLLGAPVLSAWTHFSPARRHLALRRRCRRRIGLRGEHQTAQSHPGAGRTRAAADPASVVLSRPLADPPAEIRHRCGGGRGRWRTGYEPSENSTSRRNSRGSPIPSPACAMRCAISFSSSARRTASWKCTSARSARRMRSWNRPTA